MKPFIAFFLVAAPVLASAAPADTSAASPLMGAWSVDISRLPIPPQARPQSVTIAFSKKSESSITMDVRIVDAGGAQTHAVGTTPLDGTPTHVAGSNEADTSATEMPQPNVLVLALAKNGIPASTRIYTVSADGKNLIETVVYFDFSMPKVMRTNYFSRVQ